MAQDRNVRFEENHAPSHHTRRKSGGGAGLVAVIVALVFIVAPFLVPAFTPIEIDGLSRTMLVGFGVVLLIIGGIIYVITRMYLKAAANEAFVKTGMGGRKAIVDGGAIVIPVVHEVVWVSLETMKLEVVKYGKDALLTLDKLRVDIRSEFFIRVDKTEEGVMAAATSLGDRCSDSNAVKGLVEAKLVSALRVVAATMNLEDLNQKRDKFAEEVQKMVQNDIKHNGYVLESVTISHLDQAPPSTLDPENNVFDAEGARRIAEITSQASVARNQFRADAERTMKQQDVAKDQALYDLEVTRANAEAAKKQKIAEAQATADAEAAKKAAEQDQIAKVAEVTRDQAVKVAEVAQQQAVEVANQAREKAVKTAEIDRQQATEVANRKKEIAIANAEKDRADAEAERLAAEEKKEAATQAVTTVTVKATAEREAARQTIAKKAAAEQLTIERQAEATVEAFKVVTEAEAEKKAADAKAAARLRLAQAEKDAETLQAEGKTAVDMVPVTVAAKQVEVNRAAVEVTRADLAAKAEFSAIASELQIALAKVEADKDARVAGAQAMGQALGGANMNIYGDPAAAVRMLQMFTNGQANGQYLDGLSTTAPKGMQTLTLATLAGAGGLLSSVLERITGKKIDADYINAQIDGLLASDTPTLDGNNRTTVVERAIKVEEEGGATGA